ncbi:hypothetical protein V8C42DRAFT_321872 [Trichoderma barbatum]
MQMAVFVVQGLLPAPARHGLALRLCNPTDARGVCLDAMPTPQCRSARRHGIRAGSPNFKSNPNLGSCRGRQ